MHEAGHIVVARVLDMAYGPVSIVCDEQRRGYAVVGSPGEAHGRWVEKGYCLQNDWTGQRLSWLAFIISMMAAGEAERLFLKKNSGGDSGDQWHIDSVAPPANCLVSTDADWLQVKGLAKQLTWTLLFKHEAAIKRVAEALERDKTLSVQDIDALVPDGSFPPFYEVLLRHWNNREWAT